MMTDALASAAAWPFACGEMADRIRAHDWAATPLGPAEAWPERLRAAVDMILAMPGPATILWGPAEVQLYNDAYVAIAQDRHPGLLGRPAAVGWPEVYEGVIAPLMDAARAGRATRLADCPVALRTAEGREDERVFDTAWSPLRDEAGTVAGALQTLIEVTESRRAGLALRQSEARNAFLVRFSDAVRGLSDPALVAKEACLILSEQLGTDRTLWAVLDWGAREYVADWAFLADGTRVPPSRWPLDERQPFAADHLAGRTVAYDDASTDPRIPPIVRAAMDARGLRAGIAVPVVLAGVLRVVLSTSQETAPRRWPSREIAFVEALAHRAWAEIERVRAEASLRESQARQAFLLAMGDAMREVETADAVIAVGARMLGEQLRASRIVFAEIDEAAGLARIRRGWAADGADAHPAELRLADFGGPLLDDLRAGRTVRYDDVGEPPYARPDLAALAAIGIKAGLSVPLRIAGRFVVNLNVHQDAPRVWSDAEVRLVEEVAERIWTALRHARAETALRRREEDLRTITDNLPALIGYHDRELRYRFVNAEFARFFGMEREEIIGRTVEEIAGEETWGRLKPLMDRALAGEAVQFEDGGPRFRSPGVFGWTEENYVPRFAPDGSVEGFYVLAFDITERKRRDEALRESEGRFRSFAENSADVLWIVDAAMQKLEYLSPAFETIWGESRERVTSDLGRWAELVHPEDRAKALDGLPRLLAGEAFQQTYRIVRPSDEAIRYIQDTGFPIRDEDGRIRRVAGIAQDVTEQQRAERRVKKSERRLRSLVEGIPQLVWRSRAGGRWTWSSPQWSTYTGLSEARSRDLGWLEALHPNDRDEALAAWARADAETPLVADYRLCYAKDGRYRWFSNRAMPVRDEATGEVLEWLGTSTDVDDLRALQEHERLLLAELQHRVRNTLAVVRSVARRTALTSASVDDYAMHLDGRLSALARVQAAVTRNPAGGIDLEHLVVDELLAYAAREGGRVSVSGPPLRLTPKAAESMGLALHELATNAVKHGALSAPKGRVRVTWRVAPNDGGQVILIDWKESGLPGPAPAPVRSGFGTELLERTLVYELSAKVERAFEPGGLRCTIALPVSERVVVPLGPAVH